MKTHQFPYLLFTCIFTLLIGGSSWAQNASTAGQASAQDARAADQASDADLPVPATFYEGLEWRNIGPNRGGRSLGCAGSPGRPNEYYFGATGGGLWKTVDGGNEWKLSLIHI